MSAASQPDNAESSAAVSAASHQTKRDSVAGTQDEDAEGDVSSDEDLAHVSRKRKGNKLGKYFGLTSEEESSYRQGTLDLKPKPISEAETSAANGEETEPRK